MRTALSALAVLALVALAAPRIALAQDQDGDGWTVADGDCADVPTGAITSPELVNPGAYDIPGNGIDDDCDGVVDNPNTGPCSPAAVFSANAVQLASALDLCQTTTLNAPLPFRRWGLILAVLQRASGTTAPAAAQSSVLTQFGTQVFPQKHATMAAISSGVARDADDTGFVPVTPGFDSGLGTVNAPSDFATPNGGLYHATGCVEPHLPVYDSVKLRLQVRVPTNASGFTFRHRFFSAEYPDQCSTFNDHLLALLTSSHPGVPANKNVLFDSNSSPMTVQTALFQCCLNCPLNDVDLQGTG